MTKEELTKLIEDQYKKLKVKTKDTFNKVNNNN